MKYGESFFDIGYLLFAIISGFVILTRSVNNKDTTEKIMGYAALILGCGDAFHLIPRVLNYFADRDFTMALGVGKLVTSVTMTLFYMLLYYLWMFVYGSEDNKRLSMAVWRLSALRILLCLFPQNGWLQNDSSMVWGIIRNIPFVILGGVICYLYYDKRRQDRNFRLMWVYILLSFLFYIPVAVFAGIIPMLGMLMLPKTICYILMIIAFLRKSNDIFKQGNKDA